MTSGPICDCDNIAHCGHREQLENALEAARDLRETLAMLGGWSEPRQQDEIALVLKRTAWIEKEPRPYAFASVTAKAPGHEES